MKINNTYKRAAFPGWGDGQGALPTSWVQLSAQLSFGLTVRAQELHDRLVIPRRGRHSQWEPASARLRQPLVYFSEHVGGRAGNPHFALAL